MENFFNWMSKPIPHNEVVVWFEVHNIIPEKVELFGDIFLGLSQTVLQTYLGHDSQETRINMSEDDIDNHFEWCWKKVLRNFELENIHIENNGEHKNYLKGFFYDSFYNQERADMRDAIPKFIKELFDLDKPFAKSDLDILTEIYRLLDRSVGHV